MPVARLIYDAASEDGAKVADYMNAAGWNMPVALSQALIEINNRLPICGC